MAAVRSVDLLLVAVVVLCTVCSALNVDLTDILKSRYRTNKYAHKRSEEGNNPCPQERPFPCQGAGCIPMAYLCDDNKDCDDGYDEDPILCTAAHRPPVQDILDFIQSQKAWLLPNVFGKKPPMNIAHDLAVSKNIDEFRRRAGLSSSQTRNLKTALKAVRNNDVLKLRKLGMPSSDWSEVEFIFDKLVRSGFEKTA